MPRCVSQYHSLPFRPQSIFKASASLVILVSTCPIRAHPSSEHLCAILVTAENIGTSQGAGWVYLFPLMFSLPSRCSPWGKFLV